MSIASKNQIIYIPTRRYHLYFLILLVAVLVGLSRQWLLPPIIIAYIAAANARSIHLDYIILFTAGLAYDIFLDSGLFGFTSLGWMVTQWATTYSLSQKNDWPIIEIMVMILIISLFWAFYDIIKILLSNSYNDRIWGIILFQHVLLLPCFLLFYRLINPKTVMTNEKSA